MKLFSWLLVFFVSWVQAEPQSLIEERQRRLLEFYALGRVGDDGILRDKAVFEQRPYLMMSDNNQDGGISFEEYMLFVNQPGGMPAVPLLDQVTISAGIAYADTNHHRQRLDVVLPKEKMSQGLLPVVVYIHGGGWALGSKELAHPRLVPIVARGTYAGISIGYRLSDDVPFPAQIYDVKAGIRWIRANAKQWGLDARRIAVIGESAGGHLAALLGVTNGRSEYEGDLGQHQEYSSDVQLVIDLFGPANMTNPEFIQTGLDSFVDKFLGPQDKDFSTRASMASPLHQVNRESPPFLLIHGTEDPSVPYSESVNLEAALKAVEVPVKLFTVEGGGHGTGFGPDVDAEISRFLDKHFYASENQ